MVAKLACGFCVCICFASSPIVRAENNSNYIYNGTTTNFGGAFTLPKTSPGTNNSLQILNNGAVTNTTGLIGNNSADMFNYVLVDGTNSLWINTSTLSVGYKGLGNQLIVTNGGYVSSGTGYIGYFSGNGFSTNTLIMVTGSNSVWTMGANNFQIQSGEGNQLIISAGGKVTNGVSFIEASHSIVTVTGSNSLWRNNGQLTLGHTGLEGQLIITNAGTVFSTAAVIGQQSATGMEARVTGPGSLWTNTGTIIVGYNNSGSTPGISNVLIVTAGGRVASASANDLRVGSGVGSVGNQLIITNGGIVDSGSGYIGYAGGANNSGIITGTGSVWNVNNVTFEVGFNSSGNRMTIADGGRLNNATSYIASTNNSMLVTDAGSLWKNTSALNIGFNTGVNNTLLVTNGGAVVSASALVGYAAGASNNVAIVTGAGSVWTNTGTLGFNGASNRLIIAHGGQVINGGAVTVGGVGFVDNHLIVTNGGLLQANSLTVHAATGNSIDNYGGTYQFTTTNITITPNGFGRISITNGTISFRGITNANPNVGGTTLTNLAYYGVNGFRLNNSTNAAGLTSYTFDDTGVATNYARLQLVNNSTWRSSLLTIGTGGSLLVSNSTAAAVNAMLTNRGTISAVNSTINFASNVTVTSSGALSGGAGDRFEFQQSLFINSTNATVFDLAESTVAFTGGATHTNAITGLDLGVSYDGLTSTNFAYGRLSLAAGDHLYFTDGDGNGSNSNALYIAGLDLGSTNNVSLLHSSFNLYYDSTNALNAYLNAQTYSIGGGSLIPLIPVVVPEPSSLLLFGAASLLWCRIRRRS
jgi:T5SS/PEP-CTERM-associated repeat protein